MAFVCRNSVCARSRSGHVFRAGRQRLIGSSRSHAHPAIRSAGSSGPQSCLINFCSRNRAQTLPSGDELINCRRSIRKGSLGDDALHVVSDFKHPGSSVPHPIPQIVERLPNDGERLRVEIDHARSEPERTRPDAASVSADRYFTPIRSEARVGREIRQDLRSPNGGPNVNHHRLSLPDTRSTTGSRRGASTFADAAWRAASRARSWPRSGSSGSHGQQLSWICRAECCWFCCCELCSTYPAAVADESKQLLRAWTQWAGRGNVPVADVVERAVEVLLDLGAMFSYSGQGFFPHTIRGRVRACRRGGYEEVLGVWQQPGRAIAPVTVVLDGNHRFIEGDDFTLSLADVTLLGILDYPTHPRATKPTGTELRRRTRHR